jgi:hypothetical protein
MPEQPKKAVQDIEMGSACSLQFWGKKMLPLKVVKVSLTYLFKSSENHFKVIPYFSL